uniref:Uncharacterized protein n=1 Tax=Nelumbo nucifera TaxID=4432 RepID=A0A822YKV5_NELNU|nr:TPA_asm: hypothetical protein HUJ06_011584 [Nelumbo nucifera]
MPEPSHSSVWQWDEEEKRCGIFVPNLSFTLTPGSRLSCSVADKGRRWKIFALVSRYAISGVSLKSALSYSSGLLQSVAGPLLNSLDAFVQARNISCNVSLALDSV